MIANKYVIGITGQSGSGKGYVSEILKENGIPVADTDIIGHNVILKDMPAYSEIVDYFGCDILDGDKNPDRKKLAKIVFSDAEKLKKLSEITHKHIKAETLNFIENSNSVIVGVDGAVIIDSPVECMCDCLIAVLAPFDVRVKRVILRDGIDEESAKSRLLAQKDEKFYSDKCDYVINNDGTLDVEKQVEDIIKAIKEKLNG